MGCRGSGFCPGEGRAEAKPYKECGKGGPLQVASGMCSPASDLAGRLCAKSEGQTSSVSQQCIPNNSSLSWNRTKCHSSTQPSIGMPTLLSAQSSALRLLVAGGNVSKCASQ